MTVIDILFRVDEICNMKSTIPRSNAISMPLATTLSLASALSSRPILIRLNKSETVSTEKNRAAAVALSAEVRRIKARLMEEVPKLQKLVKKKVKGISKEGEDTRFDLVLALPDRIKAIPDGSRNAANETGGWGASSSNKNIKFDSSGKLGGLDTLKNIGLDMNEEMDGQVPLMGEIDTKVDKATSDIQRTNVRLKKTVTQYTEVN
ncbi:hypothetical protein REPUB_Repub11eG0114000 [Reevesia pubescens]